MRPTGPAPAPTQIIVFVGWPVFALPQPANNSETEEYGMHDANPAENDGSQSDGPGEPA
jgi:hypothetical protein